jgi:hypothetical protein
MPSTTDYQNPDEYIKTKNSFTKFINENLKIVVEESFTKKFDNETNSLVIIEHIVEEKYLDANDQYIIISEYKLDYNFENGSYKVCFVDQIDHPNNTIQLYNYKKYSQQLNNKNLIVNTQIGIFKNNQLSSLQNITENYYNVEFNQICGKSFYDN